MSLIAYQLITIFIVGFISDLIIHLLEDKHIINTGLDKYYESLSSSKYLSYFLGGIFGGIACLYALLVSNFLIEFYLKKQDVFIKF